MKSRKSIIILFITITYLKKSKQHRDIKKYNISRRTMFKILKVAKIELPYMCLSMI